MYGPIITITSSYSSWFESEYDGVFCYFVQQNRTGPLWTSSASNIRTITLRTHKKYPSNCLLFDLLDYLHGCFYFCSIFRLLLFNVEGSPTLIPYLEGRCNLG